LYVFIGAHQTSDLVNFEYDGRGNTVKISTQEGIIGQYRYDATNKMTHAINKKGIRSEYIYDGAGRRVKQKVEEPNINDQKNQVSMMLHTLKKSLEYWMALTTKKK
jgi:YD repeat-containing protein